MSKRGQISSQVFVYILTVVIVGVILVMGYNYVSSNKNIVDKSELLQLQSKLSSDIGLVAKDYGTFKKVTYALPQNLNEVCFLDLSKKDDILSSKLIGFYPLIKDSLASNLNKNVFFVGGAAQQAIQIANIKLNHYPYINCFHAKNNKIEVGIEGLGGGNSLILADFVTQAKISRNSNTVLKSADELITIDVPQGTEGADTISIEMVDPSGAISSNSASDIYKFGHSPTRFSKPVGLTIKYNPNTVGECPQKLTFYQYNDDGSLEAAVPSKAIDCKNKIVVFEINGFSLGVLGTGNSPPTVTVSVSPPVDRAGFPIYGGDPARALLYSLGTNARGVDLAQLMEQFLFPRLGIPAGDPEGVWVPTNPLQKCVNSVINSYTASTPTASQTVADLFDLIVQKCSTSSTLTGGGSNVTCKSGVNTFEVSGPCGIMGGSCSSNSYSAASFKCYDGFSQHLDSTSCKNTDAWLQLAEDACFGHTSCTNGSNSSTPVCGDGIINAGETCDDGNTINGDGCSATCQIESLTPPILETATVPCIPPEGRNAPSPDSYIFISKVGVGAGCYPYMLKQGTSNTYKFSTNSPTPTGSPRPDYTLNGVTLSVEIPVGITVTGARGTKTVHPYNSNSLTSIPLPAATINGNTVVWTLPKLQRISASIPVTTEGGVTYDRIEAYSFEIDTTVDAIPIQEASVKWIVASSNAATQTRAYKHIIGAPQKVGNFGNALTGTEPVYVLKTKASYTDEDSNTEIYSRLFRPTNSYIYLANPHELLLTKKSESKTYTFINSMATVGYTGGEVIENPSKLPAIHNVAFTVEVPSGVTITGTRAVILSSRFVPGIGGGITTTTTPLGNAVVAGDTVTWNVPEILLEYQYSGTTGYGPKYYKFYIDTTGPSPLQAADVKWSVHANEGAQNSAFEEIVGAPAGTGTVSP